MEISDLGQSIYLSESLNYKKEILRLSLKEKTAIRNMKKLVAHYEWIMMSWVCLRFGIMDVRYPSDLFQPQ